PVPPPPSPRRIDDDEDEELDLNKTLGVQRFQQILHPPARGPPEKHRAYNEEDFEYHRQSSHHIHHPLSKLPPEGKTKKSKKKKKKEGAGRRRGSGAGGAPTIEEDEEEEEEAEGDATTTPTPSQPGSASFPRHLTIVPETALGTNLPEDATPTDKPVDSVSAPHKGRNGLSSGPSRESPSPSTWGSIPPSSRVPPPGGSRSYDLQERRRSGNMTCGLQEHHQRQATDDSEAQMLGSADLDGIKSEYQS
ncbi:unnamed protein product, partial [Coregonus sp. 'balchen']